MGYMRHHAIVVTGPEAAYKEADSPFDVSIGDVWGQTLRIAEHHTCSQLVSPILNSLINHSGSFFIAPDGSKEGWTHSAIGDKFRADVIAYLDSLRYEDGSTSFDYAEIQFGDDNKETKVTAASDFSAAQPGKKEGESTDSPSTVLPLRSVQTDRESTTRAAGTSATSAAPQDPEMGHDFVPGGFGGACAFCGRIPTARRHRSRPAEPAPQVTAPQPQVRVEWSERKQLYELAETICDFTGVGLYDYKIRDEVKRKLIEHASSLLAERNRTIAELRAKSEHYRVEAINQGCKREQAEGVFCEAHSAAECKSCPCCAAVAERIKREQAEQKFKDERAIKEAEKKILLEEIGERKQAEQERDALKGSTWGAAYEVTQKAVATAERLRGLLRDTDAILGQTYHAILALRQRIQKELEGRP